MRPGLWQPPVGLSAAERAIVTRIKRATLFVFLRLWRHELFDVAFQEELAAAYAAAPQGRPPLPPAQLALATVLQAYTGASDDEVIEATVMDRRWQLVLDCLEGETAPFSKGTLVAFRRRLIEHDLDRRLVERTVALAERVGPGAGGGGGTGFSPRALRAALDSSPWSGCARGCAGRVEDTSNLLGHARRKALALVARQSGRALSEMAAAAGTPVLGGTSLKAALELDWDDPAAGGRAEGRVLATLAGVERYLATQPLGCAPAGAGAGPRQSGRRAAGPRPRCRTGGAGDLVGGRAAASGAPGGRAGPAHLHRGRGRCARRKSKAQRVDGYKRHALRDLDRAVVRAVAVTPANVPEAQATDALLADLARQDVTLTELHIDRAYLSSPLVGSGLPSWPSSARRGRWRAGGRFENGLRP